MRGLLHPKAHDFANVSMLTGVDPYQATLMLAEHVKVSLFEPGLFPNSDASFGDDCNEQGSAPLMNGLAILQPLQL